MVGIERGQCNFCSRTLDNDVGALGGRTATACAKIVYSTCDVSTKSPKIQSNRGRITRRRSGGGRAPLRDDEWMAAQLVGLRLGPAAFGCSLFFGCSADVGQQISHERQAADL